MDCVSGCDRAKPLVSFLMAIVYNVGFAGESQRRCWPPKAQTPINAQVPRTATLEKMSGRAGVTSSKLWVNSLHHQAVNEPGEGLKIVARDRDNIVQAIESTEDIPILGVQWHPEYLFYLPSQLAIFRWLLSHAKKNTDGNLMDSENLTNEAKQ